MWCARGPENFYAVVEPRHKIFQLVRFLQQRPADKILLFAATCAVVDYFALLLQHLGMHWAELGTRQHCRVIVINFQAKNDCVLLYLFFRCGYNI